MPFFDFVLVIIIGGFGLFGVWFGLIHTLGSLLGTVLGVFLASRWYVPFADWLVNITGWTGNFPKVIMFILAFVIINRLVGFAFWVVDRLFSPITRLPFISGLNRILGLIFGVFEGVVVLGIIFYFIGKYPLGPWFMTRLAESFIAPYTVGVASLLWPLLPEALKNFQSSVGGLI